jgi:ABC-type transporter Mla subunit MlaD
MSNRRLVIAGLFVLALLLSLLLLYGVYNGVPGGGTENGTGL